MFQKKKSKDTTGLIWNSSRTMTMTSTELLSTTWKRWQFKGAALPLAWRLQLCYTPGWSEEAAGLSRSHPRCGAAPGWKTAGTGWSQSRWSKTCRPRHLRGKKSSHKPVVKKWCYSSPLMQPFRSYLGQIWESWWWYWPESSCAHRTGAGCKRRYKPSWS